MFIKTPIHRFFAILILSLAILVLPTIQQCTVCQKCTNCSPDVLADAYIDGIDNLLQNKIKNIGYPVTIKRTPLQSSIIYQISYSNGFSLILELNLKTLQVKLVKYFLDSAKTITTALNIKQSNIMGTVSAKTGVEQSNSALLSVSSNASPTDIRLMRDNSRVDGMGYQSNNNNQSAKASSNLQVPSVSLLTTIKSASSSQSTNIIQSAQKIASKNSQKSATAGLSSITSSQFSQTDVADINGTVNYVGTLYVKANSSLSSQQFVSQYVNYLATYYSYPISNFIGVYVHPTVPTSILFRYKVNNQFVSLVTTTINIQRILNTLQNGSVTPSTLLVQKEQVTQKQLNSNQNLQKNQNFSSVSSGISQNIGSLTTKVLENRETQPKKDLQPPINLGKEIKKNSEPVNTTNETNKTAMGSKVNVSSKTSNSDGVSVVSESSASASTNLNNKVVVIPKQNNTQSLTIIATNLQTQTQKSIPNQQTANLNNQYPNQSQLNNTTTKTKAPVVVLDANCLCYEQSTCIKCAHRFYLNNNQCISVPKECYSYDIVTGACVSCAPGYQFQEGRCKQSETTTYVMGNQCVACFSGYKMLNQRCVYSPSTPSSNLKAKNILCVAWKDSSCVLCMPRTYLSSRGICELVDPFCTQFDYNQEVCNGCQQGFSLRNGRCFRI